MKFLLFLTVTLLFVPGSAIAGGSTLHSGSYASYFVRENSLNPESFTFTVQGTNATAITTSEDINGDLFTCNASLSDTYRAFPVIYGNNMTDIFLSVVFSPVNPLGQSIVVTDPNCTVQHVEENVPVTIDVGKYTATEFTSCMKYYNGTNCTASNVTLFFSQEYGLILSLNVNVTIDGISTFSSAKLNSDNVIVASSSNSDTGLIITSAGISVAAVLLVMIYYARKRN